MIDDKSYLIGYILGDGMLRCYKGKGCEVKITEKEYNHIVYIVKLMENVYGVKPRISKEGRYWKARTFRKRVYDLIKNEINILLNKPNSSFIGGLFDAEGDCTVSKKRVRLTNRDLMVIKTVLNYLTAQGIKANVYKRVKGDYTWYTIEIYGSHAKRALRVLDLRHPKWMLCFKIFDS